MPYYISQNNTQEFGNIIVRPNQWYRRLLRIGNFSFIPHVKMQNIKFILIIEKLPLRDGKVVKERNIYIRLGDGSYRVLTTIDKKEILITGIAEYTGDTKIFIAPVAYSLHHYQNIEKEGLVLFDEHVLSINNFLFGGTSLFALIIAILCAIFSWILGFIKIGKY